MGGGERASRGAGAGRILADEYSLLTPARPEAVWRSIETMGGRNPWYSLRVLWLFRGAVDRVVGGVGLRRGRPVRARLQAGDAVDCWRVEHVEEGRRLLLRAEMRFPGVARLELVSEPQRDADERIIGTRYGQRIRFQPHGVLGVLYWTAVLPVHGWVFRDVARTLVRRAERLDDARDGGAA
ncbi:DUF2867 domain-containing protein [Leucobacter tardus]|uniref:DUF2867 domain-containing protein n=1 Tax=Leucobacter tardus TaxID=501483 RepID=A0A939TS23_9MICO|nr:DUF2867 domain-containing protein [Leucobacter tardus]MBO2990642.1 DUF2867 domain-containing protein [Leucobacter tardus]